MAEAISVQMVFLAVLAAVPGELDRLELVGLELLVKETPEEIPLILLFIVQAAAAGRLQLVLMEIIQTAVTEVQELHLAFQGHL